MCKVLNYPRSTYYEKQKEKPASRLEIENQQLEKDILAIYHNSGNIYGAPKIHNY